MFVEVVKEQTVINHLARHIQESPDPKKELLKFKNFKPPAEQIKAVKKVLKENEQLQQDSRYALKELQQKVLESGLKLSYEQLSLNLIWL
jgi:hypothetical protein